MKIYDWILFDADDTLFHFDAFRGLQLMFLDLNIQFTEQDFQVYQATNKSLWVDYQNGAITSQQLQRARFQTWSEKLHIDPQDLNNAFMAAMAEICAPLEGAVNLLHALRGKAKLGIITNGFTELQQTRLNRTGLNEHFELLVISEQIGVAKPHIDIFNHALASMGNPAKERVLMVGDTPESDILGGINAGIDTCWLNVDNKPQPDGITPTYQVSSLLELETLLIKEFDVQTQMSAILA